MGDVVNFLEVKKNINKQKIFEHNVSGNINQYLIDGHKYLDQARHCERQINDFDNRMYFIENRVRELKEEKQKDDLKAVTAFVNALNRGCTQAEKELKEHFPETYKHLKEQQKGK